uniref:Uncharacterized protein n=1 Tax=Ignisphaera aggregans TaxID=334771 RepID=A0A7J2U2E2_9CREN
MDLETESVKREIERSANLTVSRLQRELFEEGPKSFTKVVSDIARSVEDTAKRVAGATRCISYLYSEVGTGIMTLVVSCDVPRYGRKLNYKQQLLDYDIDVEPGDLKVRSFHVRAPSIEFSEW